MNSNNDKPYNSLQTQWGEDKQARWNEMRSESIAALKSYMNDKPQPTFQEAYQYAIDLRVHIAKELSPHLANQIAYSRKNDKQVGSMEMPYITPVLNEGTYKDFLPALAERFDAMKKESGPNVEHTQYDSPFFRVGYGLSKEFQGKEKEGITIKHDGIEYSTINQLDVKRIGSNELEATKPFNISHTPSKNVPLIMEKVAALNQKLDGMNADDPAAKIKVIKEMMWHMAHAMPQKRGSAAIGEMYFEALLQKHNIEYTGKNSKMPVDLIALFSTSPENFSKGFSINPEIEKKAEMSAEKGNKQPAATTNKKGNSSAAILSSVGYTTTPIEEKKPSKEATTTVVKTDQQQSTSVEAKKSNPNIEVQEASPSSKTQDTQVSTGLKK